MQESKSSPKEEREMQESKSSPKEDQKPESEDAKSSPHGDPNPEPDEVPRFDKSLDELRDLRSQLHYAADYCEIAFLKAKQKKLVIENTKDYIRKAMITVIDHLGNVSANLECLINGHDEVSQTEFMMDVLQQRLHSCKEYTRELGLAQVRWTATLPRYNPRYSAKLIEPNERSNGGLPLRRDNTDLTVAESKYQCQQADWKGPCIKKVNTHLTPEFEFSPVWDGPSILSKPRASSFGSQTKDSPRFRYDGLVNDNRRKKSVQSSNFMPFLRRSKRAT